MASPRLVLPLFQQSVICLAWRPGALGASGGMGTRISPARALRASAQTPGPAVETRRRGFIQYNKTEGNQVYR